MRWKQQQQQQQQQSLLPARVCVYNCCWLMMAVWLLFSGAAVAEETHGLVHLRILFFWGGHTVNKIFLFVCWLISLFQVWRMNDDDDADGSFYHVRKISTSSSKPNVPLGKWKNRMDAVNTYDSCVCIYHLKRSCLQDVSLFFHPIIHSPHVLLVVHPFCVSFSFCRPYTPLFTPPPETSLVHCPPISTGITC